MPFQLESQAEPIPGYKLLTRLGAGGFGEVWKAEAPGGLLKAIKFVYGDLQTGNDQGVRAEQELKSLSRVKSIRHPYILSLERFDIINGQLMIVMELADRNLWDRFRECRSQNLPGIPREELLRYLEESAEALDLMNAEYQLQHLDIKPQNIFLVYNHIKVADFGLVKDLEGKATSVTGGVTPIYAAPEMFHGWVSRYCDQYSLAIVYQELLTAQRPFSGSNVHQLIMQHLEGQPNLAPLPPDDRDVIARALSKKPEDRYPSCTDLVMELRAKSPPGVEAPPRHSGLLSRAAFQEKLAEKLAGAAPAERRKAAETPRSLPQSPAPPAPPRPEASPDAVTTPKVAVPDESAPPEESITRQPPTEVSGEGELFPALVVGLGQTSLPVLHRLHAALRETFGSREVLPNVRLLYLDTDPEAVHAIGQGNSDGVLPGREVLLARLNRSGYYLKPREGRPRLETWFNTNLLYRIQRNQVTGGVRALGRLAFIDNYRAVSQRLRSDLEAVTDHEALLAAAQKTGRKLRTNRPRVYVVAGLAGGTGGGIFLDLAYALRHLLRQLGYPNPDLAGLLLLPPVTENPSRTMALGNAFAALTELNHFSSPEVVFSARYDDREGTIEDSEPPFKRCFLWTLPEGPEEPAAREAAGPVSQFLFRELTTPLGRAADSLRASRSPRSPRELACETVGLCCFSWPRSLLLQGLARRLCHRLLQRWTAQGTPAVRTDLDAWIKDQWAKRELGLEAMSARLQAAGERALGQPPEAAFTGLTEPLVPRGWWNPQIDPQAVLDAVARVEQWFGHPSPSTVLNRPGTLEEAIRKETEPLGAEWKDQLARLTLPLIDHPDFRLAGAEETTRQLMALIDQVLREHEPVLQELTAKAAGAQEKLQLVRPGIREIVTGGRRTAAMTAELLELLRRYPRWRYQALVLRQVLTVYGGLRVFLADQLREAGFCRGRLSDLLQSFAREADGPAGQGRPGQHFLYPDGCRSLDEAVGRLEAAVTPAELDELDRRVQQMIAQQFRSLIQVCTTSSHLMKNLEGAMLEEAVAFAGGRVTGGDTVELFLNRHPAAEGALGELSAAFQEAAPGTDRGRTPAPDEFCILAVPPSPWELRLRELSKQAVPLADWAAATSPDDIVIYREETRVDLARLAQMGPRARAAYEQMTNAEHLSPHSRIDVADWLPLDPRAR